MIFLIYFYIICFTITNIISAQQYVSSLSVSFNTNSSEEPIEIIVTLRGHIPDSIWNYNHLKFCIYLALDKKFKLSFDGSLEFPIPVYKCIDPELQLPFIKDHLFINSTLEFSSIGMDPGTYLFHSFLIAAESKTVLAEETLMVDTFKHCAESPEKFNSVPLETVQNFHFSMISNSVSNSTDSNHRNVSIVIFLKDNEVHGANMRLVSMFCQPEYLYSGLKIELPVTFIIPENSIQVDSSVSLFDRLRNCSSVNLMIVNNSIFQNQERETIRLSLELISYLSQFDIALTINTMGDPFSDLFFRHIEYIWQQNKNSPGKKPIVMMDLCNLTPFFPEYTRWSQIVSHFIAPSLYTAHSSGVVNMNIPTSIVYPLPSIRFLSEEFNQFACHEKLSTWPRKIYGKYRIGCIGNMIGYKSPGICVKVIYELMRVIGKSNVKENFQFVYVGSGFMYDDIKKLAIKLEVIDYIEFMGFVDGNLGEILSTFDVAINPSTRGESFGILNVEAVLSCTPVLAFNRSANQESLFGYILSQEVQKFPELLSNLFSVEALGDRLVDLFKGNFNFSVDMIRYARKITASLFNPQLQLRQMNDAIQYAVTDESKRE